MDNIIEPTSAFDFSSLSLVSPTSLNGGNYFIRILNKKQEPVYIQPPKCSTKQGILSSGKKMFCDLVFKHEDEVFLEFLESLETYCHKQIFSHKDRWFEPGLTMVDIENSFVAPSKTYKSGKFHIVRANVPLRLKKCDLKIFDENEQDVPLEQVKEGTDVMTIIEIQGIRCSARSFQIEIEVKQMLVVKPKNLFEKCLFTKALAKESTKTIESINDELQLTNDKVDDDYKINSEQIPVTLVHEDDNEDEDEDEYDNDNEDDQNEKTIEKEENEETNFDIEDNSNDLSLAKTEEDNRDPDFCEVTLDLPTDDESCIKIKNPSEAHYEMYKEAKRKAQIARDLAIAAYMSAKQIKNEYFIDQAFSDDEEMKDQENELKTL